jgi:hypothetical protein
MDRYFLHTERCKLKEKVMIKSESYTVGSSENTAYKILYEMIPQDDVYMHLRLSGALTEVCKDIYFVTHEDGKGISRVWMCYGNHENAVANWGAVFTEKEYRGKGYCAKNLDYCFEQIEAMKNQPLALFCTAGDVTALYRRYGFVPAIMGTEQGPLYRPCAGSPKTFQEFCENYYTPTDELFVVDADFGWRNEIDCLLRFALLDMGEEFGINGINDLYLLLMKDPKRARIVLTKENKCVGWVVDDIMQLHPAYRDIKSITVVTKTENE